MILLRKSNKQNAHHEIQQSINQHCALKNKVYFWIKNIAFSIPNPRLLNNLLFNSILYFFIERVTFSANIKRPGQVHCACSHVVSLFITTFFRCMHVNLYFIACSLRLIFVCIQFVLLINNEKNYIMILDLRKLENVSLVII